MTARPEDRGPATGASTPEDPWRALAPRVLAVLARRSGDFGAAEDAVQEALVAAATTWPERGTPDNPVGWLITVASRRLADRSRSDRARRRREDTAARSEEPGVRPAAGDDSLTVILMCCHDALSPAAAIPLTLRAVGGLTTREIAAAFLLPEATTAQRISRAKARIAETGATFDLPPPDRLPARLRTACHVLYLIYNEGYASTAGAELSRPDLSAEAIRLARMLHSAAPADPEVTGLLALMLLTDARRPARTGPAGELVPLAEQDRSLWDHALITEGLRLATEALGHGAMGEYQALASIAALHDEAASHASTDWRRILALYRVLERITDNPIVTLNRAVATGMADGPAAGLAVLEGLDARLGDHHRLHAVRAHLLELAGRPAAAEFRLAAARATNERERDYLIMKAASAR